MLVLMLVGRSDAEESLKEFLSVEFLLAARSKLDARRNPTPTPIRRVSRQTHPKNMHQRLFSLHNQPPSQT